MSYIVFARKYRPQTFDDIIGQPHITTTLKNAISQDRIAHAYIFAGPRGVGKTTTARILAKALNCEKGPAPTPCGKCGLCQEMAGGSSLDILEIDGASNRGIDEIRNLRENVKFLPSKGRFKVYIIDEVHMLTEPAFNALLKTLEEPPPHVKFIFATTQGYKVPATILSRCQRFDFRRIPSKDISENLRKIAGAEGLNINGDALDLIAKYSDGSMRDGQVMLDQIVSFASGQITREEISKILGIVDDEALFQISGAIREKDSALAVKIIDGFINDGKDIIQAAFSLIEHFRNMAIIKIGKDLSSLIDAGPDRIRRYEVESNSFSIEEILYIIYALSNTVDFIRKSSIPRIPMEAALIKLTQTGLVRPLPDIIKRLDSLGQGQKARVDEAKGPIGYKQAAPKAETLSKPHAAQAASESQALSGQLDEILSAWGSVINYLKTKKISIASYLQEGYPVGVESNKISIGFSKEFQFHKEVLDSIDNKQLIEDAVKSALNRDYKVSLVLVEPVNIKNRNHGGYFDDDAQGAASQDGMEDIKRESDPILKTALEIFGGEVAGDSGKKGMAR